MKSKQLLPFLIAAFTVVSVHSQAQTPGAVASTPRKGGSVNSATSKASNKNSQHTKHNAHKTTRTAGATEDQKYRQSSASNGTSINNSNATNHNSNNATNPATGVGSPTGGKTGSSATAKTPRQ
jgi:hypothetical protein